MNEFDFNESHIMFKRDNGLQTERLPENYVPTMTNEEPLESSEDEYNVKENGAPENILETIESDI